MVREECLGRRRATGRSGAAASRGESFVVRCARCARAPRACLASARRARSKVEETNVCSLRDEECSRVATALSIGIVVAARLSDPARARGKGPW